MGRGSGYAKTASKAGVQVSPRNGEKDKSLWGRVQAPRRSVICIKNIVGYRNSQGVAYACELGRPYEHVIHTKSPLTRNPGYFVRFLPDIWRYLRQFWLDQGLACLFTLNANRICTLNTLPCEMSPVRSRCYTHPIRPRTNRLRALPAKAKRLSLHLPWTQCHTFTTTTWTELAISLVRMHH